VPYLRTARYTLGVAKPPTVVDLTWVGGYTFTGISDKASITLDSPGLAGPSPVQALAFGLAGCMAMDLVHILTKGRHSFRALRSHLVADRSQDDPHRILSMALHFTIEGDVTADAVERAIALSRERYCSVWHSMRQDIAFTVTHDIHP
jgi:putative redox protein